MTSSDDEELDSAADDNPSPHQIDVDAQAEVNQLSSAENSPAPLLLSAYKRLGQASADAALAVMMGADLSHGDVPSPHQP